MDLLPRDQLTEIVLTSANPAAAIATNRIDEYYQHQPSEFLGYLVERSYLTLLRKFEPEIRDNINNRLVNELMDRAILSGQRVMVEYLINLGAQLPRYAASLALVNDHRSLAEYLLHFDNVIMIRPIDIMFHAASRGSLETIKVMTKSTFPSEHILDTAATGGHLNIVIYLIELGVQPSKSAIEHAVLGNHLDVVKYLAQHVQPTRFMMYNAIQHGNLDMVKYLSQYIQPTTDDLLTAIARRQMEVVEFLAENLVTPTSDILEYAIQYDMYDMVEYLMDRHRLRVTTNDLKTAVHRRSTKTLEVIATHPATTREQKQLLADLASEYNYTELNRFMYRLGYGPRHRWS